MKVVYDIETFSNFFSYAAINIDTGERYFYIISSWKDDRKKLFIHLSKCKVMVGYNNDRFDAKVIFNINNKSAKEIYTLSQQIINEEKRIYLKNIPIQLDLYLIWHFNNRAKATSLKDIEMAINWWNLHSLPHHHSYTVKEKDVEAIKEYNFNDVLSTLELYNISKGLTDLPLYEGKDKIQFRIDKIKDKTLGKYLLNANDVKIGEEINKKTYLDLTGLVWKDIKDKRSKRDIIYIKDLIPSYIKYKADELNILMNKIKLASIDCSIKKPNVNFKFEFANNIWKFGLGGIHTVDSARIIIPEPGLMFNERDVGSMYPNKIDVMNLYPAHLGPEWLVGYRANKIKRLDLKALPEKTKSQIQDIEIIKLSLNGGGFGKTGEEFNWQYDPLVKYTTTIQCQLDILMLADMLWSTGLIEIESGNTDGINILYDKEHDDIINSICKEWEVITQSSLETTEYSKLIRTSVNDYMAIKPNGSVKFKGDFEINKELHKNHSQRIRGIAISNYFFNNIPVEETINNHLNTKEYKFGKLIVKSHNIFDFCMYIKAKSNQYYTITNPIEDSIMVHTTRLLKNNRYIITTDGGKLTKCYSSKKEEGVNIGYLATLANTITKEFVVNINYDFYINEVNKIIKEKVEYIPILRYKDRKKVKSDAKQLKLF